MSRYATLERFAPVDTEVLDLLAAEKWSDGDIGKRSCNDLIALRSRITRELYRESFLAIQSGAQGSEGYIAMGQAQQRLLNAHRARYAYMKAQFSDEALPSILQTSARETVRDFWTMDYNEVANVSLSDLDDKPYRLASVELRDFQDGKYHEALSGIESYLLRTFRGELRVDLLLRKPGRETAAWLEYLLGTLDVDTMNHIVRFLMIHHPNDANVVALLPRYFCFFGALEQAFSSLKHLYLVNGGSLPALDRKRIQVLGMSLKRPEEACFYLANRNFRESLGGRRLLKMEAKGILSRVAVRKERKPPAKPNVVFISTIPKSASTYLNQVFGKGLGYKTMKLFVGDGRFNRGNHYQIVQGWVDDFFAAKSVCREHFYPQKSLIDFLKSRGVDRVLVHVRDPRQAMISRMYYEESVLFKMENDFSGIQDCNLENDFECLADRIDFYIENYYPAMFSYMSAWIEFAENDPDVRVHFSTFEEMVDDRKAFLRKVQDFFEISDVIDERKLAAAVTKKRIGKTDEWRELCSERQIARMNSHFTEEIAAHFGYRP